MRRWLPLDDRGGVIGLLISDSCNDKDMQTNQCGAWLPRRRSNSVRRSIIGLCGVWVRWKDAGGRHVGLVGHFTFLLVSRRDEVYPWCTPERISRNMQLRNPDTKRMRRAWDQGKFHRPSSPKQKAICRRRRGWVLLLWRRPFFHLRAKRLSKVALGLPKGGSHIFEKMCPHTGEVALFLERVYLRRRPLNE